MFRRMIKLSAESSALFMAARFLAVAVTSCGAGDKCGTRPPGFSVRGGGFWDEGKARMSLAQVNAVCKEYDPVEQALRTSTSEYKLPDVDIATGLIKVGNSSIKLDSSSVTKYRLVAGLTAEMVVSAKQRCLADYGSYACVVFSNPSDNPQIMGAHHWEALSAARSQVGSAVKAFLTSPEDKAGTEDRVKKTLDALPVSAIGTAAPLPGSVPSPSVDGGTASGGGDGGTFMRGSSPSTDDLGKMLTEWAEVYGAKLDHHAASLESVHGSLTAVTTTVKTIETRESMLGARLTALEKQAGESATGSLAAKKCVEAMASAVKRAQEAREKLVGELNQKGFQQVKAGSLYEPVEIHLQQDGFRPCKADLNDAMRASIDGLTSVLGSAVRTSGLMVVVEGYSDEQPIWNLFDCKPFASNAALALGRASAVADALKTKLASKQVKVIAVGHDNLFVEKDCNMKRTNREVDECHTKNRRFNIEVSDGAFGPSIPPECATSKG